MLEQEIAVYVDDTWTKNPRYQNIQDIGRTFEWYVAEWFRSELKAPARHGVNVQGIAEGGDLDAVAFVDDMRMIVEYKSGSPSNITQAQMELFLCRVADFNPTIALLLIDTENNIDNLFEMIKRIFLESKFIGPHSSRQLNVSSVHIRNIDKSIGASLRDTLQSHNSGKNS